VVEAWTCLVNACLRSPDQPEGWRAAAVVSGSLCRSCCLEYNIMATTRFLWNSDQVEKKTHKSRVK
jgi:hypothetical protein